MLRALLFAVFLFAFLPLVLFFILRWFKFLYGLTKKELKIASAGREKTLKAKEKNHDE
ncbi:MAG: hypothetical protein LBC53_09565 [Spirochaetaceae bacterium]|jgi:hypothetical protein|nr:hypothetical protein [Spirochaetaceae bacterium]